MVAPMGKWAGLRAKYIEGIVAKPCDADPEEVTFGQYIEAEVGNELVKDGLAGIEIHFAGDSDSDMTIQHPRRLAQCPMAKIHR